MYVGHIRSITIRIVRYVTFIYKIKNIIYVYILNRRGPRMDHCGIPDVISDHVLNVLFTLVLCFRPEI